ncbi:MAG TPA: PaaI family thioesterase [Gemmatimonadales bacterium]|nr:PaaI family thioesterase [Gemmatimonadales bacterium]
MATASIEQINRGMRGFDRLYGLEFVSVSDEEVRAQLKVRAEVTQPYGLIHGGVYASMAESMASIATALGVAEEGCIAVGLSNSTSFLRPITEGVVDALATRLHRGRTTWVWDVRFNDTRQRLCALTRMTVAVRPAPDGSAPFQDRFAGS